MSRSKKKLGPHCNDSVYYCFGQIEVRPWYIADTVHCSGSSKTINSRKAVFVGGVPRPLKASELAEVMTDKFGDIILVIIDSDCDLKYPKGQ